MKEPEKGAVRRVAVYCDHWQNGGAESYLMNQFRHWGLSLLRVTLVTTEKTTGLYDEELRRLGICHVVLLGTVYASPVRRILNNLSHCRRYFWQNPCDIAYFNLTNSVTMLYVLFAKQAGVPKRIVHSHCSGIQQGGARWLKSVGHRLARGLLANKATDWWACSDLAAKHLFPPAVLPKVVYIPNAIDTQAFRFDPAARQRLRAGWQLQNAFLVGTVGRCAPEKNQGFLLEAFALLRQRRPDARLLLVGDGPLLPELKQKAEALGIRGDCIFYGFAKAQDIPGLLSAMDVFCLPSKFEGFGIALIEAQANGLPCVASDAIPQAARLCGQSRMLPAAQSFVQQWADALAAAPMTDRPAGQRIAEEAGFAIAGCAKAVQGRLIGNAGKREAPL